MGVIYLTHVLLLARLLFGHRKPQHKQQQKRNVKKPNTPICTGRNHTIFVSCRRMLLFKRVHRMKKDLLLKQKFFEITQKIEAFLNFLQVMGQPSLRVAVKPLALVAAMVMLVTLPQPQWLTHTPSNRHINTHTHRHKAFGPTLFRQQAISSFSLLARVLFVVEIK